MQHKTSSGISLTNEYLIDALIKLRFARQKEKWIDLFYLNSEIMTQSNIKIK